MTWVASCTTATRRTPEVIQSRPLSPERWHVEFLGCLDGKDEPRRTPMILFARPSASRTSPSPWYHRRLACVPAHHPRATIEGPERRTLPAKPFADIQRSLRWPR